MAPCRKLSIEELAARFPLGNSIVLANLQSNVKTRALIRNPKNIDSFSTSKSARS